MKESFPGTASTEENSEPNHSRRSFIKKVLALGAAAAVGVKDTDTAWTGPKEPEEELSHEQLENEITRLRERIRTERSIELDFSQIFPGEAEEGYAGIPLESLEEKYEACLVIFQALQYYPPFMHKETGLSIIRVVNDLKRTDEAMTEEQDVSGVATPSEGIMHFEYSENNPIYRDLFEQLDTEFSDFFTNSPEREHQLRILTLHHELEHFVDSPADKKEYEMALEEYSRETRDFWYGDSKLPSILYTMEIDYLESQKALTPEEAAKLRINYYGFARRYGKTNFSEDKATVAEALFCPEIIGDRLNKDTVLSKKMAFLKRSYFMRSRGTMNQVYWELVQKGQFGPQEISEYLDLQKEFLSQLSDEDLVQYVQSETGKTLTSENILEWRETLGA